MLKQPHYDQEHHFERSCKKFVLSKVRTYNVSTVGLRIPMASTEKNFQGSASAFLSSFLLVLASGRRQLERLRRWFLWKKMKAGPVSASAVFRNFSVSGARFGGFGLSWWTCSHASTNWYLYQLALPLETLHISLVISMPLCMPWFEVVPLIGAANWCQWHQTPSEI